MFVNLTSTFKALKEEKKTQDMNICLMENYNKQPENFWKNRQKTPKKKNVITNLRNARRSVSVSGCVAYKNFVFAFEQLKNLVIIYLSFWGYGGKFKKQKNNKQNQKKNKLFLYIYFKAFSCCCKSSHIVQLFFFFAFFSRLELSNLTSLKLYNFETFQCLKIKRRRMSCKKMKINKTKSHGAKREKFTKREREERRESDVTSRKLQKMKKKLLSLY